jgi:hypothetical protein
LRTGFGRAISTGSVGSVRSLKSKTIHSMRRTPPPGHSSQGNALAEQRSLRSTKARPDRRRAA